MAVVRCESIKFSESILRMCQPRLCRTGSVVSDGIVENVISIADCNW
jgi:hypothetical protein